MLHSPGFYYVKKPKRFVILSSDKSSERNLSCFFDIIKPRRMEHLQSEEPFSSDPYFRSKINTSPSLMGIQRVSLLRYAIEQNDDDKKYILVEETSVTIFRPGLSTYLYQVFF